MSEENDDEEETEEEKEDEEEEQRLLFRLRCDLGFMDVLMKVRESEALTAGDLPGVRALKLEFRQSFLRDEFFLEERDELLRAEFRDVLRLLEGVRRALRALRLSLFSLSACVWAASAAAASALSCLLFFHSSSLALRAAALSITPSSSLQNDSFALRLREEGVRQLLLSMLLLPILLVSVERGRRVDMMNE